jgi:hypothetical protein
LTCETARPPAPARARARVRACAAGACRQPAAGALLQPAWRRSGARACPWRARSSQPMLKKPKNQPPRFIIGPTALYSSKLMFRLVGETSGHTAMSESYIRIRGFDMKPGTWRIRVGARASPHPETAGLASGGGWPGAGRAPAAAEAGSSRRPLGRRRRWAAAARSPRRQQAAAGVWPSPALTASRVRPRKTLPADLRPLHGPQGCYVHAPRADAADGHTPGRAGEDGACRAGRRVLRRLGGDQHGRHKRRPLRISVGACCRMPRAVGHWGLPWWRAHVSPTLSTLRPNTAACPWLQSPRPTQRQTSVRWGLAKGSGAQAAVLGPRLERERAGAGAPWAGPANAAGSRWQVSAGPSGGTGSQHAHAEPPTNARRIPNTHTDTPKGRAVHVHRGGPAAEAYARRRRPVVQRVPPRNQQIRGGCGGRGAGRLAGRKRWRGCAAGEGEWRGQGWGRTGVGETGVQLFEQGLG